MGLPLFDIRPDQIFPQYLDISSCTDISECQSMCVFCCKLRMIELLSGRLCNVTVDGGVGGRLFCSIGGNFLLTAKNRRRCSVLTINDRKLTTFYRRYYDGSEL
jgi:hypothetical protein